MSLVLCNVGVAQPPGKSAKPAKQIHQTLQLPDQSYSIDSMDWKHISGNVLSTPTITTLFHIHTKLHCC